MYHRSGELLQRGPSVFEAQECPARVARTKAGEWFDVRRADVEQVDDGQNAAMVEIPRNPRLRKLFGVGVSEG